MSETTTTNIPNGVSRNEATVEHISDAEMKKRIEKWNDNSNMYVASIDATIVDGEKSNNGSTGTAIQVTKKSAKKLEEMTEEEKLLNVTARPENEKSKALKERAKNKRRKGETSKEKGSDENIK